ncbi:MAG: acyl--CoA ligase [Clostridiales bacterium]|nr:acyl--CoA ligase [Clostridiales bacterium]
MVTCYEFLHSGVNRNGYIVYYGHKLKISQFLQDIESFSGALIQLGLNKGDVVTLYLPTCPQALVAFYACSKLGMIANIIHPLVPVNLLADNLRKTNSKVLLFYDVTVKDENPLTKLGQLLIRCSIADYVHVRKPAYALYSRMSGKRVGVIDTYAKLLKKGANTPTELQGKAEDLLCYMHSGGTSGEPKIVMLNNNAFNSVTDGMFKMYHPNVQVGDFNLATLPVFHAYGLCSAMHGPLSVGYSLILVPKFDTKAVSRYINKYRVTVWSVVPAMLKKMLKDNTFDNKGLSSLDVIWCGGDVCEEALVERVNGILSKYCSRARLMRGYGLTEVCGVCIVNNYDFEQKGSCGRPMPGNYVQIWDDYNNILSEGELGEIIVSGNGVMNGYIEGGNCLVDMEGKTWVKTGDIGYISDGYLHVVDRKKRSIKIAAVNVFPSQIEQCVSKLDFVSEACAVGVKVDGKQFVKVYVTLAKPTDYETVKREVTEICRRNLIRYAVPRYVEVIEQMPRTDFGKIDFRSLENK